MGNAIQDRAGGGLPPASDSDCSEVRLPPTLLAYGRNGARVDFHQFYGKAPLGVLDQTAQSADFSDAAKLFGQPEYACAFSEPVRDCPHHADLEDHAEPKSRF